MWHNRPANCVSEVNCLDRARGLTACVVDRLFAA